MLQARFREAIEPAMSFLVPSTSVLAHFDPDGLLFGFRSGAIVKVREIEDTQNPER